MRLEKKFYLVLNATMGNNRAIKPKKNYNDYEETCFIDF